MFFLFWYFLVKTIVALWCIDFNFLEANYLGSLDTSNIFGLLCNHLKPFFERGLANDDNYHAFCHLLGQFKVNYQGTKSIFKRHTEFALIFLPSLLCFKMADRRGSRKTPLSLNNHHYCLLQDLSAPPSTLSMMMVFPNSQGSLILILLHLKRSRRLPTKTMIIFPMVLILCLAAYHCATVLKILNQLVSKMSQVKLSLVRCLHHQLLLGCLITLQY
ncbi:uncharacterized protein LOC112006905 isoform X2 [Quercus suber]|uniref:uncharacterized protein LOC112006905 isoform X2 n=1 Tax=Quercus suber TaxID=58331 RepID=UPI0032DEC3AC